MDKKNPPPISLSRPKPIVPRRLVVVFAACLAFIVFYAALLGALRTGALYSHITDPTQQQENARVIAYVMSPIGSGNTLDFLTPTEQSHMSDVKRLFDAAFIIYLAALGIVIGTALVFIVQRLWQRFDELLARSLRAVGWTLLGFCAFAGLAALLDFTKFWILFHAILFPQGNWMFPYDSVLITLYPQEFFEAFVLRVFLYLSAFAIVSLSVSFFMLRMRFAEHSFDTFKEGPRGLQQKVDKDSHAKHAKKRR